MKGKSTIFDTNFTINCRGKLVDLNEPVVMGILNITPDSFYDGGKYNSENKILLQVTRMITEGAKMIDVGAFSSRPGAVSISVQEEKERLFPVLKVIRKEFPDVIISVDTYNSDVAKTVISDFGVDVINDITAGTIDANMYKVIAKYNVPYIIMHMKGSPANMQEKPEYDDVVQEIIKYFSEIVSKLKLVGINDIIIDPGFGFGKTIEHNYKLLNKLDNFKIFELPLLVGVSRKSFIYKLLNSEPLAALNGTTVANTIALLNGAKILRVHDVQEATEAIKIVKMLKQSDISD